MRRFSGGRLLGLRSGLAIAIAAAALSMAPSAAQAAFTLTPCHGSATAGRGATFPALLHNGGFWGSGFDSAAGCSGSPAHPTYNSATIDSTGTARHASINGSGGGVGACGGGAGSWPAGHRDTTVRFCATDDPVSPTQLTAMNAGCDTSAPAGTPCQPGVIHQLPWASGAVTVAIHLPEGCSLPAPGTTGAGTSPTTGWTDNGGTTLDPSGDTAATNTTRPYITDAALEKALAGDPSELYWGQLVPNMTGTPAVAASGDKQDTKTGLTCTGTTAADGIPVIRIVRSDNSGTTFNFKAFLGLVHGGLGNDSSSASSWTGTTSTTGGTPLNGTGGANTAWPEGGSFSTAFNAGAAGHQTDAGNICEWSTDATTGFPAANSEVATNHICGGHSTGAGNVDLGVLATNGSIGYVDIATARNTTLTGVPAPQQSFQDFRTTSGTRDDTFWIPVQNNPDQTSGNSFVEPTKDATNHQASGSGEVGTRGANCSSLPNLQNVPTAASSPGGDATRGDWSHTVAVGGAGYPICLLTYGLVWDDNSKVYANTASEEAQARTVLDYVDFIASSFGQSFNQQDFSAPPASIQNIMKTGTPDGSGAGGIAAIGWNKSACTSNCTTSTTTISTTKTTTTTTVVKPPPSSQFTVSGLKVKGRNLALTLKLPGGGRVRVVATFRSGRKTVTFASLSSSVHGGNGTVTLVPTSKARSAVNNTLKTKFISVRISITFTPTGGHSNTKTATLKVRGAKNSPKHKRKKKH